MTNPFKIGFANVDGEKVARSLPIDGKLPGWLIGSYITNGPAVFDLKDYSFNHWFDGLAMLTAFTFNGNGVDYQSRFVRSDDYKDYAATGTVEAATFATKGHKHGLDRLKPSMGKGGDNANVNVSQIDDRFYTMDESAPMIEFDPRTLDEREKIGDRGPVEGQVTTAHPIYDRTTGETVNYVVHYGTRTAYNIFSFDPGVGNVKKIASVPVKEPSYMHSFALTSGHVILTQNPLVANPLSFIASSRPFYEHYVWKQDLGTRFTIVPRGEESTMVKETDPLFCYHHVNAFEKDGTIQCDLLAYPDASIVAALGLDNLRSNKPENIQVGRLKRFSISLEEGSKVHEQMLSSEGMEFPRIDPRRTMMDHRFVYGPGQSSKDGTDFLDRLLKVDISDGTNKSWKREDCYPGEAVFVPRPDGEKEDDGMILSNVLDTNKKRSFLLILDATSFDEIATIDVPQIIPFKFHGMFHMAY